MLAILIIIAIVAAFSVYDYLSSKNWQLVTSDERNETVFKNRNKAYGAYQIRRNYDSRLLFILIGVSSGIFGIGALNSAFGSSAKEKKTEKIYVTIPFDFSETEEEIIKIEEIIPTQPEVIPPSTEFREVIVTDTDVDVSLAIIDAKTPVGLVTTPPGDDTPFGTMTIPITTKIPPIIDKPIIDPLNDFDEAAQFPGGIPAVRKFIADNIDMRNVVGEGKMYMQFVVDTNGKISRVSVTGEKVDCDGCEKAAINVIKSMPDWIPARKKGERVNSYYRLPINIVGE